MLWVEETKLHEAGKRHGNAAGLELLLDYLLEGIVANNSWLRGFALYNENKLFAYKESPLILVGGVVATRSKDDLARLFA